MIASNAHADLPERAEARAQHLALAKKIGLNTLINETYMPNYLYQQRADDQQLIVQMAAQLGLEVFGAQLQVLAKRPEAYSLLKTLCLPSLIIGAEQDPLCPVSEQQRIHQLMSGSKLVLLADSGHFVTLEAADKTNSLITEFLEGLNG